MSSGGPSARPLRSLPAEAVEFTVPYTTEKRVPFVRRESEDRPLGVPAVANTDLIAGQASHLDAVASGETEGTLYPARTCTRLFGRALERRSSHVATSLTGGNDPKNGDHGMRSESYRR